MASIFTKELHITMPTLVFLLIVLLYLAVNAAFIALAVRVWKILLQNIDE